MHGFSLIFVLISVLICKIGQVSADNPASPDDTKSAGSPKSSNGKYDYDLIVVGGGSGGLAAAKDAYEKYQKKVLVVDYVAPSPLGSHWKEGGTCVNVGCIPKKLMHQASLVGEAVKLDAKKYGWKIKHPEKIQIDWKVLVDAVQAHVKSVNWVTLTHLSIDSVRKVTDYINGLGEFVDANTIKVTFRDREHRETGLLTADTKTVTADKILIAVGGRPSYPAVKDVKKLTITSDDLFSMETPPGKTLIIGAGYIGMECAGFLNGLGYDVTVMVRSVVLRGFDQEMARMVRADLEHREVKFLDKAEMISISEEYMKEKVREEVKGWVWGSSIKTRTVKKRKLRVKWKITTDKGVEEGEDLYDTVLVATGRRALTAELKVENANVKVEKDGKINAEQDKTNIANIYAVGDVLYEKPELTPVAIQAGKLLMARLYSDSVVQMDYNNVPTTVFTPLEYSFVGLSEEKAEQQYGADNLEVYHSKFTPLEFSIPKKGKANCYLKVICKREGDQQVLGLHFFGPTAGEVVQGYAAALKAGLTFKQLQETVGIHPTVTEEFTRLYITKRSKIDPTPQSCCS